MKIDDASLTTHHLNSKAFVPVRALVFEKLEDSHKKDKVGEHNNLRFQINFQGRNQQVFSLFEDMGSTHCMSDQRQTHHPEIMAGLAVMA